MVLRKTPLISFIVECGVRDSGDRGWLLSQIETFWIGGLVWPSTGTTHCVINSLSPAGRPHKKYDQMGGLFMHGWYLSWGPQWSKQSSGCSITKVETVISAVNVIWLTRSSSWKVMNVMWHLQMKTFQWFAKMLTASILSLWLGCAGTLCVSEEEEDNDAGIKTIHNIMLCIVYVI